MAGATICGTKGATGLVVIITNDYSTTPHSSGLSELRGTLQDGQALSRAFAALGFAVCWKNNVTGHTLCGLISEMRSLRLSQVRGYRCIIFVFAGHGCEGDYLWMQDGSRLHVNRDVVDPLLPKNAKEIGNIEKAFLIDACRGKQTTQTTLVPRSSSVPDARGGSLVDILKVCTDGNFLLAYSTMPMHKAYEDARSGGVWLSTLAKLLNGEKSSLISFDLEYLLTEVNKRMDSSFQQPERLSRLNGHISLSPKSEKVKRPSIAAVFPSGSENCANGSTDVQKADAYALLLSRYTRSCGMEESYADTPCFVEEYNHTYYTSQLEIKGSGTWEGTRCHFSPEIAREEVAKMAYQSLTGQSVGPTTLTTQEAKQLPMINPSPSVAPRVSSTPNHRTLLNEYCQKYGVSHRHEFIEDHSTGQAMFKCTITCLLNGSKIVQDSGQYYPKKDDAREIAAHRILLKIKEREKSHSRGATGVGAAAAAASNAPNMIWKSRLKERYDKQGKAGLELKYKVTEVEGGFVASVFIPELSREVKGEKGRTKKEAEQNTAKKAIQLLPK